MTSDLNPLDPSIDSTLQHSPIKATQQKDSASSKSPDMSCGSNLSTKAVSENAGSRSDLPEDPSVSLSTQSSSESLDINGQQLDDDINRDENEGILNPEDEIITKEMKAEEAKIAEQSEKERLERLKEKVCMLSIYGTQHNPS
jgi:hypothetical protein